MLEALLFAEHGDNMLCTKIVQNVGNNFCTQHVLPRFELGIFMYWTCNSMNNLLSYCGLVDAKIRPSDKDLPVSVNFKIIYRWRIQVGYSFSHGSAYYGSKWYRLKSWVCYSIICDPYFERYNWSCKIKIQTRGQRLLLWWRTDI